MSSYFEIGVPILESRELIAKSHLFNLNHTLKTQSQRIVLHHYLRARAACRISDAWIMQVGLDDNKFLATGTLTAVDSIHT